jgi:uncharacterized membrane protein
MKRLYIALISVVTVTLIIGIGIGIIFLGQAPISQAAIEMELNPSPPLSIKSGEELSFEISLRNTPGFKATAEGVEGLLELPNGFIDKSLNTQTRQFIFGRITPGEGSHYSITIAAANTVEPGEYHAKLTVWGANISTNEVDLKIMVMQN